MEISLSSLKNKWYIKPILIGVFIRLILIPITVHPDFWGQSIATYFFAYKGTLNFYNLLYNLPLNDPIRINFGIDNLYIYPPLTYFTQGLLRLIVRPFSDPNFIPFYINHPSAVESFKGYFFQVFLIKAPYLFVDVLAGVLLAGVFSSIKKKKLAFWLWMLNPITIYVTFMIFQNDILPTLFVIISLLLYERVNC